MGIFDYLRKYQREFQQGAEEERLKLQAKALKASKPTDDFVIMTISGDGELEKLARAGWEVVSKVYSSEHSFLNQYLIRKRREDLQRSLGL